MSVMNYLSTTGFAHLHYTNIIMMIIACIFIYLAVVKDYEPLLLVPIGFGVLIGNIPPIEGLLLSVYDEGSVLSYLYMGVSKGIYPPLIFLGLGAMTDFSTMLSNPKLVLLGAAAQIGIFGTFVGAMVLGFTPAQSGAIGIIGGADGPTAIFLSSMLAPELLGPIAIAAYSYMALVPIIQPPIIKLFTTRKERLIRMEYSARPVSKRTKVIFPILTTIIVGVVAFDAIGLVGMLMMGNLIRESGVVPRLASGVDNLMNIVIVLLGLAVGATMPAAVFLQPETLAVFFLGLFAFISATIAGIFLAKLMNLVTKTPVNPMIGAAGVSAVPMAARVVQQMGQDEDPQNFLLMHAMGPNVAGVIGTATVAGVLVAIVPKLL